MRNIPVCRYHYSRPASKQCCICNEWFCKYCKTIEINGKIYCEECAPYVKSYRFEANIYPIEILPLTTKE